MIKEYYVIEEFKNGYYKTLDNDFTNIDEVKRYLKTILDNEVNYNYKSNKDNTYTILKAIYNSNIDMYEYNGVLPKISIKDYSYMSYDEKEKYFKGSDF